MPTKKYYVGKILRAGQSPENIELILDEREAVESYEVLTGTKTIATFESGRTYFLDNASGFTATLPDPQLGLRFKFVVKTAPTTDYVIATNGGENVMYGTYLDIVGEQVYFSAQDQINFVASTSVISDNLIVECDGTNWQCLAFSGANGGITTAVT